MTDWTRHFSSLDALIRLSDSPAAAASAETAPERDAEGWSLRDQVVFLGAGHGHLGELTDRELLRDLDGHNQKIAEMRERFKKANEAKVMAELIKIDEEPVKIEKFVSK